MSSIDSRIVQLKFDNASFEANVRTTIASLDRLKAGLNATPTRSSFGEISKQAGATGTALSGLHTVVDGVSAKFLALGTIAVTALATITSAAIHTGAEMVKSLSLEPIMTGFNEYETQMKSIQTILSNTQAAGTDLQDVSAALDELNEYSDKTIYNFTEMTKNIGAFTAAGVGLTASVAAIKGIANLAAMSGSTSQQAATAMYQLSQAISAGRVSLADWNSVVNAGMGGTVFQRSLAETAVAMGVLDENALKLSGDMKTVTINGQSFRESISTAGGGESWLTSEVLTTALSTLTGDLTDAELAAIGFSKAQIKAIQAQADTAVQAATQVKTLSQVFEVAKETMGSGWAKTFKLLFGDFNEAKSTFTDLSNTINTFITSFSDARNNLLAGWKELGGREVVIEGIKNAFQALISILKPIGEAFRQIFPPKTAQDLLAMSESFRNFTEKLKIGAETASVIKRVFAGVFAAFNIGKTIITGLFTALGRILQPVGQAAGGLMDLAARLGDWLVNLNTMIQQSGVVTTFFENLGDILAVPIKMITALGQAIANLFSSSYNVETAGAVFDRVGDRVSGLNNMITGIKTAWENFLDSMTSADSIVGRTVMKIREDFRKLGDALVEGLSSGDFSAAMDAINTGLFAGLLVLLKRFVDNGAAIFNIGFSGKMAETFNQFTQSITKSLNALTLGIKAEALLKISIAVGILAASLIGLSLVDSKKLASGIAGISVLFVELTAALTALDKYLGGGAAAKLPLIGAGLILISVGVLTLAIAVKKLSEMDMDKLATGLAGVAGGMAVLVAPVAALGKTAPSMVIAAASMIGMSIAMVVMSHAVENFGNIEWEELGRGLAGLAASMAILVGGLRLMPSGGLLSTSMALVAVSTSLLILAQAIKQLGDLDIPTLAKGIGSVAASLAILAGAMHLMPKDLLRKSAGVLILSVALLAIGKALDSMGNKDPEEIARSLISLAGALTIIAVALNFMTKAIPGAAALGIVAAALLIFVPALAVLGNLPIPVIVTGLVALAAAFAVLGAAGIILSEAILPILGLAAALLMIGAAVALVGVGVWAFVKALQVLVEIGKTAADVLANSFLNIGKALPALMATLSAFLIGLAGVVAAVAPEWQKAFTKVLSEMLTSFIKVAPKAKKAIDILLDILISVANAKGPDFIDLGYKLLLKLVSGLADRIGPIVNAAVDLITTFLDTLGSRSQDLVEAGLQFIIDLANGIADGIRTKTPALREAGKNIAGAIVSGLTLGMSDLIGQVVAKAGELAGAALNKIREVLQIASPSKRTERIGEWLAEGLGKGIIGGLDHVTSALESLRGVIKAESDYYESEVKRLEQELKALKESDASEKKIEKVKQQLLEARKYSDAYTAALATTNAQIKAQRKALEEYGRQWDTLHEKLATAKQDLESYDSETKTFYDNLKTQYSQLPDIAPEDQGLDPYFNSIRQSTQANQTFLASLNELRAMGLDDTSYQKLLNEGIDAQPFIDSLKAAGPSAVAELNTINAALIASATAIADTATPAMRDAGRAVLAGIVSGLETDISTVEAKMTEIGRLMVRAIKKELKIKSPSKAFAEVGFQSNMGLAKGLKDYSKYSSDAAENVGQSAVDSLKSSLDDISHLDFDTITEPVITPVLDLETFMKDASSMDSMLPKNAIVPVSGKMSADQISQMDAVFESLAASLSGAATSIEYNQYNNSPKALSSAEIYRRTKNQLSVLKGALTV